MNAKLKTYNLRNRFFGSRDMRYRASSQFALTGLVAWAGRVISNR